MSAITEPKLINILDRFRVELVACKYIGHMDQCFAKTLGKLGLQDYAYVYYSKTLPEDQDIWHLNTSDSMLEWTINFHKKAYHKKIYAGRKGQQTFLPLIMDMKEEYENAATREYRKFIKSAQDYGIKSCMVVPLFGSVGGVAILVLYHEDIKRLLNQSGFFPLIINQIGLFYHYHISKFLHHLAKEKTTLTERELECLLWTARNKEAEEVAKIINRTKRTVDFHLSNANKKLETKNKYQAVAKAIALGLIKL